MMFKSLFTKRITSKVSFRDNRLKLLLTACFVLLVLYLLFDEAWILWVTLAGFAVLLFIRVFTAKLKLKEGDICLFFGLPGSGKSMFLAKMGYDNKCSDNHILVNEHFSSFDLADDVVERNTFGMYDYAPVFPFDAKGGEGENGGEGVADSSSSSDDNENSHYIPDQRVIVDYRALNVLLWDEASLNGFDNRDWEKFDPYAMEACKRVRKYNMAIVFANQGWDELEKKIRKSLCNHVYYVVDRGFYSVAYRLYKEINISELSSDILEGWRYPTFLERLIDPSVVLYAWHSKWGKHYDTYERDKTKPLYACRDRDNQPCDRPELQKYFPALSKNKQSAKRSVIQPKKTASLKKNK